MSAPANPTHSINVPKMLEDHLPGQIENLQSEINSLIETLRNKQAELLKLKLHDMINTGIT